MRNKLVLIGVIATLLLAACAKTTSTPAATEAPTAASTGEAAATEVATSSGPATCTVSSSLPTPGPTEASLFPPVTESDWTKGPENATMTIIIYDDFQCPYCAQLKSAMEQLLANHADSLRMVIRHFPLSMHDKANLAAQAAEAAGKQGKFWEMYDLLFSKQDEWAALTVDQFTPWLMQNIGSLNLDTAAFTKDMTSEEIVKKITDAVAYGQKVGIPGTPFMLIDGRIYQGPKDAESLEAILRLFEMQSREFTTCPEMTIDPAKQYTATIKTEKGDIVIQLYPDKAPMAVNSFVFLARQGWFDNTIFHRVIKDFVAQAGDPSGSGYGGPGYAFSNEISDLKFDKEGVVGMANSGGEVTNGSQFFITMSAQPNLDGGYTIFGQVIKGMDVVKSLTLRNPGDTSTELPAGTLIETVTIEEK